MKYQLQEGRYGEDWTNVEDKPDDRTSIEQWIEISDDMDTYDKYEHRIIDKKGNVVWHRIGPYNDVLINIYEEPPQWLNEIQDNYGIEDKVFARACQYWLDQYKERIDGKN